MGVNFSQLSAKGLEYIVWEGKKLFVEPVEPASQFQLDEIHYDGLAKDAEGRRYLVMWAVLEDKSNHAYWAERDATPEACDWDNPDFVRGPNV